MAGGPAMVIPARAQQYEGRVTLFVVFTCLLAALGGSLFGYDIGISGGVQSMNSFLKKFFPVVYRRKINPSPQHDSHYCQYNNQGLAAFTSSLYIAGLIATYGAAYTTRAHGRRPTILIAALSFLIGAALNAGAVNFAMLLLGRIMLGVGVGFGNQAVPVYLSEMAPPHWRGGLNMLFQLATTVGIFCANLVNWGTQRLEWGWRLSLGLAAVPASIMLLGGLFLFETPNSLVERQRFDEGKSVLTTIRGTHNIHAEFNDLTDASTTAQSIKHPFRNLLQKRNRPQLVMAFFLPTFQILTGINSILFYAPIIFQALGYGDNASLWSSVLTGATMVLGSVVTILTVDRFGRRTLLMTGGVLMVVCQVIIAIILAKFFEGNNELSKGLSGLVTFLICLFVLGFATSWGGLGWVVPSEIFPLEVRSAGQGMVVSVNLFFTFVIAQAFLAMLCGMKYGIFLFFAFWEAVMTMYVFFLLPETKDVPLEEMTWVWMSHWFWGRFIVKPDVELAGTYAK